MFSAAKAGSVPSLYVIPPGAAVPQPIGEPGTHLLAVSSKGEIAAIDLVDPSGGRRTRLNELGPPDRGGVIEVADVYWLPDGCGYAYSYQHEIGQLFVVSGWRR